MIITSSSLGDFSRGVGCGGATAILEALGADVSRVMHINGYMELHEEFRTPHADVDIESLDGRFFDDMKGNWTWIGLLWTK